MPISFRKKYFGNGPRFFLVKVDFLVMLLWTPLLILLFICDGVGIASVSARLNLKYILSFSNTAARTHVPGTKCKNRLYRQNGLCIPWQVQYCFAGFF